MAATVRDYYTVSIPGDLSDNMRDILEQAIVEAKERTRLYCIPAEWTATRISGEIGDWEIVVRVRRRRNRVR
jgi:hypothetical protein